MKFVERDDPLGLLALAVGQHEALVPDTRRVHQARGHAEYTWNILKKLRVMKLEIKS